MDRIVHEFLERFLQEAMEVFSWDDVGVFS